MPPPSSGGVHLVQILNILEGFPLRQTGAGAATTLHAMIEAMKPAYADRAVFLGDPALVATETARLRRNCHRLVWLNPLAGTPGYQPLAAGLRAAYPYIDDFLPAGTVASLERLGEILGGVRSADTRQGAEAAAHAALPGVADLTIVAPPTVVGGTTTDPTTARPIR